MGQLRQVTLQTSGHRHGPITRLINPGELGQRLKPFVFLDYVDAVGGGGPKFGFHPHSGIATLTYPLNFDIEHESSNGQIDKVRRGGIEWSVAGSGIWHRAQPLPSDSLQAFQLWLALPPSHENASPVSRFIDSSEIITRGPVTVLLGSYLDIKSSIDSPVDATCLWVNLNDGESWTYEPPASHEIAWAFSQNGVIALNGDELTRELSIMEEGCGPLNFSGNGDCSFLLGSAANFPYELSLGKHSVHTSIEALERGCQRIDEIGLELKREGKL